MNEETHQKLMTIKRSFRLLMNGPGSQSMEGRHPGVQDSGYAHHACRQDACRDNGYLDGTGTEPGDG